MKWISEEVGLPPIGQTILLAHPRQTGEFWDLTTAMLLVKYEGVHPVPVLRGGRWPTTYYWETSRGRASHPFLVTGNNWWALLDDIPLPPGAEHKRDREYHYISQPELLFVGQRGRG
jgi:hypothetical protein